MLAVDQQTFDKIIAESDEAKALAKFIFETYPQRDRAFATSWTYYATSPTHEEDVLSPFMPTSDQHLGLYDPNIVDSYLMLLPHLVNAIIYAHARTPSDVGSALKFLHDANTDFFECMIREDPPSKFESA